jgi:hypothetical protein
MNCPKLGADSISDIFVSSCRVNAALPRAVTEGLCGILFGNPRRV